MGFAKRIGRDWEVDRLENRVLLAGDAAVAVEASANNAASETSVTSETVLVLIDGSLADVDLLVSEIDPSAAVAILDPSVDLIQQTSQILAGHHDIAELHIVTHGSRGALLLGDQSIDARSLADSSQLIANWKTSMSDGADILLYGCDVADGVAGQQFIQKVADLTGADVAASVDKTGSDLASADWDLEAHIGNIDSKLAVSAAALSRYRHTLNVTIEAFGSTGEEIMELLIDGNVVESWNVTTQKSTYEFDLTNFADKDQLTADRIKVGFANDLYLPEQGFDRNLTVERIAVNGEVAETTDPSTFSTGSWSDIDGIAPGFNRGNILHASGFFQYSDGDNQFQFGGRVWNSSEKAAVSIENDQLILATEIDSPSSFIATSLDLLPGSRVDLFLDAFDPTVQEPTGRFVSEGTYFGVDFYDSNGEIVGKRFSLLGSEQFSPRQLSFNVPTNASESIFWIGISDRAFTEQVSSAVVNSLTVDTAAERETNPPAVELVGGSRVLSDRQSPVEFQVRFTDDTALNIRGTTSVIAPNGDFSLPRPVDQEIPSQREDIQTWRIVPDGEGFQLGEYRINVALVTDIFGNSISDVDIGTITFV